MTRKTSVPYYVNLGGLDLRKNPPLVDSKEAQISENVLYRIWGATDQRSGFAPILDTPVTTDKIRVIHQHIERATNDKTRLIVRGTNISSVDGGVETILDSSLTNSTLLGASAQLFDDSVICTGADEPRAFSNSTGLTTIDTQGFKPQWCVSFANYIVYGGDPTLPQRIVFSALGNAKSVNSNADFIDILDADQKLTGAFTLFNSLWITSIASITKIDGSDFTADSPGFNAQVRTIWKDDGSINHQSIVVAHDRAYFLGEYSVYEFDGRNVKEISELINPLTTDGINRTVITNSVSVHDKENNVVIISVPSVNSTRPDTHLVYHYENAVRQWSIWTDFTVSYWYQMQEDGDLPIPWHGSDAGQLYRHGGEEDDIFESGSPVAIQSRYKIGWQHLNGPEKRFLMKHIMPTVNGIGDDTFDVKVFVDYSSAPHLTKTLTIPQSGPIWGAVTWGAFIWGSDENDYTPTIGVPAIVCRNYSVEFIHESLGKRFRLLGWSTIVVAKGLTDGSN